MKFDEQGLIPAVVQHARSGEVLMLGYMNEQALQQTLATRQVTFWSRSRQALWTKGATSGNLLRLVEIRQDCDGDALLVQAEPAGPTCHTGEPSCFYRGLDEAVLAQRLPPSGILIELTDIINQRAATRPEGSYTAKLLNGGVDRIGKKIGEEAAEVIIAAKNAAPDELSWELADLLYHSLVLLVQQGVPLEAVWRELRRRHG
ncbi:MAG: bifunctional phosphoribosyl-AMP cyclohydrolase/phosphoribosyl-ATP diphosphatase HisIE [Kouleothrix sp.]|nr:bifunctional phosphoribosyl-AMP cyclohydrolase/phosphoribosyl-ATP diphosphatase HisIE [Kouleothrix sp.]